MGQGQGQVQVVIGGTGGAGSAIVRELGRRGLPTRVVTRSGRVGGGVGSEAEVIRDDATDPDALTAALAGAETVYQAANVPYPEWYETLPRLMESVIEAARRIGTRIVYVDNMYMYGPVAGPLTETSPQDPATRKGRLRKQLADRLLAAHAAGTVRATIGRASDYFGPGVTNAATGERFFPPILAGKKTMWPVNADVPHSLSFIDDVARVLVTLGQRDEALGEVWHAPTAPALTGRAYARLAAEAAGAKAGVSVMPDLAFRALGLFNPLLREVAEMGYQFAAPFVTDGAKFAAAFGDCPTPHDEAMGATVAWYREKADRG